MGRYWLLGRLGGGGMGEVFLGRSPGGRLVAVKVVRSELAGQADFRKRFAREVAAARTVSGLFTAPVVDADPDAPVQCFSRTGGWSRPAVSLPVAAPGRPEDRSLIIPQHPCR